MGFNSGFKGLIGIGNGSAISTSKITKITAIKKNRGEKCSRAEFFWVKPAFKWGSFFSVFMKGNCSNRIKSNAVEMISKFLLGNIFYVLVFRLQFQ